MNFEQLEQARTEYDEIMPVGRDVVKDGKRYHIIGMTRRRAEAFLYVIERQEPIIDERMKKRLCCQKGNIRYSNRDDRIVTQGPDSYFSGVSAIGIGKTRLETRSSTSGPMAFETGFDCRSALLLSEMMKVGWHLPSDSGFQTLDWQNVWLTELSFRTEVDTLPVWSEEDISVTARRRGESFYIQEPILLTVGEEQEIPFTYGGDKKAVCYLNRVFVMDVWEGFEKMFQKQMQDPRLAQKMTKEEFDHYKEGFYRSLSENCPRGTCYLGIEYECTAQGALFFTAGNFWMLRWRKEQAISVPC